MPVLVRFADGTEVRDYFDGAAPSSTLVYTAKSPAVSAAIDPDLMLLLDVNRANNAFVRDAADLAARHSPGPALDGLAAERDAELHRAGMTTRPLSPLRALLQGLADVVKAPLMLIGVARRHAADGAAVCGRAASRLQESLSVAAAGVARGDRDRSGMVDGIPRAGARAGGHLHAGRARFCGDARWHQRRARWPRPAARAAGAAGAVDRGVGVSLGRRAAPVPARQRRLAFGGVPRRRRSTFAPRFIVDRRRRRRREPGACI